MNTRRVMITTPQGVHARLAAQLAAMVRDARAQVMLESARGAADLVSPLALLRLALIRGDVVTLSAEDDAGEALLEALARTLGQLDSSERRWAGIGLVPGSGCGQPWWPKEYASDALPLSRTASPETSVAWSLARSRVDEQLAREEQFLQASRAFDLLELIRAERQLLADEKLAADLVPYPQRSPSPGEEALSDLAQRLYAALTDAAEPKHDQDIILLGYRVLLVHLLGPHAKWIRGIISCIGSEISHIAIAARQLGIPLISGVYPSALEEMAACERLLIDGRAGSVAEMEGECAIPNQEREQPSTSVTMLPSSLLANADSREMVRTACDLGAAGIGLVRSEVLFLGASGPDEALIYERITGLLDEASGRSVTVRAANLLPGRHPDQLNDHHSLAAMLRDSEMLRKQFRALLRAGVGRPLCVSLPLVRTLSEWHLARDYWLHEQHVLESESRQPVAIPLGMMIEVPALLWELDAIVQEAAFIQIGTNDLSTYLFGQNREAPFVLDARPGLQPAFWRCMAAIAARAQKANVPLTACGVMAGQWPEALLLTGLGIGCSVTVERLVPLAHQLARWNLAQAQQRAQQALNCADAAALAALLSGAGSD